MLIPAGTVQLSGQEQHGARKISATPYLYFQALGFGRVGMDGKPRPINIDMDNIQWDRTTDWTRENWRPAL